MAKTQETLDLEEALDQRSRQRREYGCREVTIGFAHNSHGDEIVDYMSMDSHSVFRCYELKVSVSDLKSDARKSWYGDYNYLVCGMDLWNQQPVFDNYIPPHAGILAGPDLIVKRKAQKRVISDQQREMLKDSLIRSVFWKMDQYRSADNLNAMRELEHSLEALQQEYEAFRQKTDRMRWTYQDYESFARRNHQDPSFTIERQAKAERNQYAARKEGRFTWTETPDGTTVCPSCGKLAPSIDGKPFLTEFCPFCGADLRKLSQ